MRRSQDRLWEDQFIEYCSQWVVPYLADLVDTRLVAALNPRGQRVDVAKTIYYRRRKGTLRVLEELIGDISAWEGKAVESFRRLARVRHGLDPQPAGLGGRLTGTLPGGWADLRSTHGAELTDSPFDEFHHMPDFRRQAGRLGVYNIPKLAFHLFRLRAFFVEGVTPKPRPDGLSFSFDPSGRDIPLFMPRNRPQDWDEWASAREWEMPAPIRCRLLGNAEYAVGEALIQDLVTTLSLSAAAAAELRGVRDRRIVSEARLRETFESFTNSVEVLAPGVFGAILAGALLPDCGKAALLPEAIAVEDAPGSVVKVEETTAAALDTWNPAVNKALAIDPELGRFVFPAVAPAADSRVSYYYGFSGEIGAGTYGRPEVQANLPNVAAQGGGALTNALLLDEGITQINDNATYGPLSSILSIQRFGLQAANTRRPYLALDADWVLSSGANLDAEILLDGVWLGAGGAFAVVLQGDYQSVTLRYCTLDPGGTDRDGNPIAPVMLRIEGRVQKMVIQSSILGPVMVAPGGLLEDLVVKQSILQSIDAGVKVLDAQNTAVSLDGTTLFGAVDVLRLEANSALITGLVDVTDTQAGCFRFSAAPPASRLPHPFEAYELADDDHIFTSRHFGQPGFGQMSASAPPGVQQGAENGLEMGAFNHLKYPVKLKSLQAKVDEYLPFGLIPVFIANT